MKNSGFEDSALMKLSVKARRAALPGCEIAAGVQRVGGRILLMLLLLTGSVPPLFAQTAEQGGQAAKPWRELDLRRGWVANLGIAAVVFPEYSGSRSYRALPLPSISAHWEDRLSISPLEGVQLNLLPGKALKFGPVVTYARGRPARGELSDLARVRGGFAGGGFIDYRLGPLTLGGDAIHAFSGGLEGYRARLQLRWHGIAASRWIFGLGPSLTWSSREWAGAYFDISAEDASRSGLPAYSARSGLSDVRLNGHLTYMLSRKTSITAFGSMGRLLGGAADSPIVREHGRPQQGFAGIMLMHRL